MGPKLLSPELKRDLTSAVSQTEMDILLTPDWKPEGLIVRGVSLGDGKSVEVVNCAITEAAVSCKGLQGNAKFKKEKPRELLYSFSLPLLLRNFALRAKKAPNQSAVFSVVLLKLDNRGPDLIPELTAADVKSTYVGDEVISIGDHRFNGRKYSIEIMSKSATEKSFLWLSGNDVVLAAQPRDSGNQRVLMSQFKKYSDF